MKFHSNHNAIVYRYTILVIIAPLDNLSQVLALSDKAEHSVYSYTAQPAEFSEMLTMLNNAKNAQHC